MIPNFMAEKLIIKFDEYLDTVEKLALPISENYKPTVVSTCCCINTNFSPDRE